MGKIALGLAIAGVLLLSQRQWFYFQMLWLLQSFDLRFGEPRTRGKEQETSEAPPLYRASGL